MLEGIALANPDTLKYVPEYNLIMRADAPSDDKVSIIQGSGSGHEPAHVMVVGKGMLDAACPGDVFAAPPMDYVLETTKLLASPKGVLLLVNNYTGDRMAFDMGQEMAEAEGINVKTLIIDDDVAVKDSTYTVGRRGVAGNFFVIKAVGAAAEKGADLDELVRIGEKVNSVTRTMGMALTACTPPAKGSPLFELGDDEMEMGVGIHGEPGRRREKLADANEIVDELLEAVVDRPAVRAGRRRRADDQRPRRHADQRALPALRPRARAARRAAASPCGRSYVGEYCTSLDMAGARSPWSSSTTRSSRCSPRPPRSPSGRSEDRFHRDGGIVGDIACDIAARRLCRRLQAASRRRLWRGSRSRSPCGWPAISPTAASFKSAVVDSSWGRGTLRRGSSAGLSVSPCRRCRNPGGASVFRVEDPGESSTRLLSCAAASR